MAARKLGGFEFYEKVLRSPRYIVAPMVDQSELAWRMLARRHGAQLCYTPMFHAAIFSSNATYRREQFTTCPEDRPLIVQFCGNDPDTVLAAAKLVEDQCDAVDLNLGCPQNIARRGNYGAFLQDQWDTISAIVRKLHENLKVPVTCKIRVFANDPDKTLRYAKMLEESGCQLLTVHGRSIKMKGPLTGLADWEIIKLIKQHVNIPVFANGNIQFYEDLQPCFDATGVDGIMTAEGHLSNPAIFEPGQPDAWDLVNEYIQLAKEHDTLLKIVKAHLFRLWHASLPFYTDMRDKLAKNTDNISFYESLADEFHAILREAAKESKPEHWKELKSVSTTKRLPIWKIQPKLHDLEKDVLLSQGKRLQTESPDGDKPHRVKKPKTPSESRQVYEKCQFCTGNPISAKCAHQRCRKCCQVYTGRTRLPCPARGHFGRPFCTKCDNSVTHFKCARETPMCHVCCAAEAPCPCQLAAARTSDTQQASPSAAEPE